MNSRSAILLFLFLELIIVGFSILFFGISITALQTTTRFSGRLSLLVFSFIFINQNKPDRISPWLSNKPYLIFALVHGIHLIELLSYVYLSNIKLIPYRLLGGFLAYVFIFVMPFMSEAKSKGRLAERKFIAIETCFQYYVWLIFFLAYLPKVLGKLPNAGGSYWVNIALFSLVILMLGSKLLSSLYLSRTRR